MTETFFAALTPMLVLFLCILTGFVLNKTGIVPENTDKVLSRVENYVLVPALIIKTFMNYCTTSSLRDNYKIIIFSAAAVILGIIIAVFTSMLFEKKGYSRNVYRYALSFANYGFMGNAIAEAIFGQAGLYNYMLFTLPLQIACYSWGVFILIPKGEASKKDVFKNLLNPVFISIFIGIILGITGANTYLPDFLQNAVSNLASCMGPIAMVLTGFVIGKYNFKELLLKKKVYVATFLRLLVIPAVLVLFLHFIGADTDTLKLAVVAFATPLGLNTVVFPSAYGADAKTGASMAMISHTLCIITIPLMYMLCEIFFSA